MRHADRTLRGLISALLTASVIAAAAFLAAVVPAAPASAAAQVTVSGADSLDPNGESRLTLRGSGFQSVQGGFGGIYVLFGWADDPSGGWRPSNGGSTGEDYRYVYDDESNPTGYQLFVTFPGSSTASAANGGEISADGTWEATIRVPGAVFQTYDRAQNVTEVDCLEVGCGIMTIGAHGVTNANNETYTPVGFAGSGASADAEADSGDADAAASADTEGTDADEAAGASDTPTAAPTGGAAQAQGTEPVVQAAAAAPVDPELLAEQRRQTTLLAVLLGIGIVLTLCVVGLSFGIGGYLAATSLLLGVNPEALEKVRARREARAVKAEARRRRRISALRSREEIRSQKAEAKNGGRVSRASMAGPEGSTDATDEALMRFFAGGDEAASGTDPEAEARAGSTGRAHAPWAEPGSTLDPGSEDTQSIPPVGDLDAEARTTVLTHVKEEDR